MSTSAIMVPYVFSAFYYLKLVIKGQGLEPGNNNKAMAWLIGIVGSIYGIWLLYASGLQYILIATILYAPGSIMYYYNRKKKKARRSLKVPETSLHVVLAALIVTAIIFIATGRINPFEM